MQTDLNDIFAKRLKQWYLTHKRDLPWRNTQDPYLIWLSEVILQQTRVVQGMPYFLKFAEKYPTINLLANAPVDEVMRLWQGLGYYSRARNMHNTAKIIHEQLKGVFPNNYNDLIKLKGIGPYTAAAIASFAFGEKVAVVDGNVYRVLARIFGLNDDIMSPIGQKVFKHKANQVIENEQQTPLYNQAIMEFGALQCVPRGYVCAFCTMADLCEAKNQMTQDKLPVKIKKLTIKQRFFYYFLIEKNGTYFFEKREGKGIWEGLYEPFLIENNAELENALKQFKNEFKIEKFKIEQVFEPIKHILTHQKLIITFIKIIIEEPTQSENKNYYELEEVLNLPKPIVIADFIEKNLIFKPFPNNFL